MDDEHLDRVIHSVRDTYRVPPEPSFDEMWREVDAELDARAGGTVRAPAERHPWRNAGIAAAAALVMGIGVGRWTAPVSAPAPTTIARADEPRTTLELTQPLQRTTTDYLGETAMLLQQVQSDSPGAYGARAGALLTTTRLLLDSPAASDPRLNALLEDLELLLAQIATLQSNGSGAATRSQEHLQLIRTTLTERDVVPRVHTAAVSFASFED